MKQFFIQPKINLKLNANYYRYSHTADLLNGKSNLLNKFESQCFYLNYILKFSHQINKACY